MPFKFEKMVAGRYLRSKRKEGFISVIAGFSFMGIMLGVATLIIVMSVMNGFRAELVGRILGLNGHVNVYSSTSRILIPHAELMMSIEDIEGVTRVTQSVEGQALFTVDGEAGGVIVRGLYEHDFKTKPILSKSLIHTINDENNFGEKNISIGKNLAYKFNLRVGDNVTLVAPKGKMTPFGTIPKSYTFVVGSIFDVGMYEYNSGFVFMPIETAQKFFNMGVGITSIEVLTEDVENFNDIKHEIKSKLGKKYRVTDWMENNSGFYNALEVERNVMFMILTLIIIVAAFNIISSLIMLVKDKGRDIAILRTMGATRGMIIRIFLYTGASIGVLGTLAGAGLGVVFCNNIETIRQWLEGLTGTDLFAAEIYFLTKLPSKIDMVEVGYIVIMALVISFLATVYPAWKAAKLDPVEGLRHE